MTKSTQIDAIDASILRIVQREGDISHAALAERIGASPASCWRRIKAMESAGILGPTVRIVDPQKMGRPLTVFCQVRMKTHDIASRQDFERLVDGCAEVLECYSMSGEWDYLLRLAVADIAEYERILMHELLGHAAVATSSSHFALKSVKYTTALPV